MYWLQLMQLIFFQIFFIEVNQVKLAIAIYLTSFVSTFQIWDDIAFKYDNYIY